MQGLSSEDKLFFRAARYMDDILMISVRRHDWDHGGFLAEFERSGGVYHAPLSLEEGAPMTFLETRFAWDEEAGRFAFVLKNDNWIGEEPNVWRYKDYRSHGPHAQKRALVAMMMKRVHTMTSDRVTRTESAVQKLAEFVRLGYPRGMLRGACNFMFATTRDGAWMDARDCPILPLS